jgi:hypothetical protein
MDFFDNLKVRMPKNHPYDSLATLHLVKILKAKNTRFEDANT